MYTKILLKRNFKKFSFFIYKLLHVELLNFINDVITFHTNSTLKHENRNKVNIKTFNIVDRTKFKTV